MSFGGYNYHNCIGCPFCKTVHATGQRTFKGCYHEPYHGKPCWEIKKCQADKEGEG